MPSITYAKEPYRQEYRHKIYLISTNVPSLTLMSYKYNKLLFTISNYKVTGMRRIGGGGGAGVKRKKSEE